MCYSFLTANVSFFMPFGCPFQNVSSNDEEFGGAWIEVACGKDTAVPRKKKQPNNLSFSWKSTAPKSGTPPRAASIKKRKTLADGLPDLAPCLAKKHRSPKLRPSQENKLCESSSKEIYPDLQEKHLLRDAPRPDEQVPLMIVFSHLFAHVTSLKPV